MHRLCLVFIGHTDGDAGFNFWRDRVESGDYAHLFTEITKKTLVSINMNENNVSFDQLEKLTEQIPCLSYIISKWLSLNQSKFKILLDRTLTPEYLELLCNNYEFSWKKREC